MCLGDKQPHSIKPILNILHPIHLLFIPFVAFTRKIPLVASKSSNFSLEHLFSPINLEFIFPSHLNTSNISKELNVSMNWGEEHNARITPKFIDTKFQLLIATRIQWEHKRELRSMGKWMQAFYVNLKNLVIIIKILPNGRIQYYYQLHCF